MAPRQTSFRTTRSLRRPTDDHVGSSRRRRGIAREVVGVETRLHHLSRVPSSDRGPGYSRLGSNDVGSPSSASSAERQG